MHARPDARLLQRRQRLHDERHVHDERRLRGHGREGLGWLQAILAVPADATDPLIRPARARALMSAAYLARQRSDYARADGWYAEALDLWRALDEGHDPTA